MKEYFLGRKFAIKALKAAYRPPEADIEKWIEDMREAMDSFGMPFMGPPRGYCGP